MTETEVYRQLTEVFHEVFGRDDLLLTPDLSADEVPDWNSFAQVEIILGVQQRFGIHMVSADVDHLANVGDLVRVILQKTAAGT